MGRAFLLFIQNCCVINTGDKNSIRTCTIKNCLLELDENKEKDVTYV